MTDLETLKRVQEIHAKLISGASISGKEKKELNKELKEILKKVGGL